MDSGGVRIPWLQIFGGGGGGVLPVDYDVTKLDNSYMYLSCTDFYQTLI